jgi:hypothetical protein
VEFLGHALRLDEVLRLDDDGAASQRSAAAAVSLTSAEAAGVGLKDVEKW